MKKKIMIFMLLLSFMVGVGVPDQAKAATETTADDVKYRDIEDFMHSSGYTDFVMDDGALYVAYRYDGCLYVLEVFGLEFCEPYFCVIALKYFYIAGINNVTSYCVYQFYDEANASLYDNYTCLSKGESSLVQMRDLTFKGLSCKGLFLDGNSYAQWLREYIVYSDLPLYNNSSNFFDKFNYEVSDLLFESTKSDVYTFPMWCDDAGLNCLSSTNESPNKIPYSYNDYWHIVRKTSNGKWLLTTIGNSQMQENITDYTMMLLDNGNLAVFNLYSGEDYNGYVLNVRQYEYDTDGWKVRTYDTFNAQDDDDCIIDLGAGSGFDQTRILAYTNIDIYDEGFNVVHPASTEYFDVTDTPVVPEEPEEPDSPTPTTAPGSSGGGRPGAGSVGGQAKPGGMLDFIITFFTLVWTKLFAVEVPVDGYDISFQAIVIFGVIAGVLIWLGKSSFGKKG